VLEEQEEPAKVNLLLTHAHWDHVQGFPFLPPILQPGVHIDVHGPSGLEQALEDALAGQMHYAYFPDRIAGLRAQVTFHSTGETVFEAGANTVQTQYLNHTCPTLGYRVTAGGTSIAYVPDHEPFWPHDPELPLPEIFAHPGDRRHVSFVAGADLLIHDAQFTAQEYPARRGWGHSPVEYAVDVALAAGVRRLALFHHDPRRDDVSLAQLVAWANDYARSRGTLEVFAAAEGQFFDLPDVCTPSSAPPLPRLSSSKSVPRVLLLGASDRRRWLRQALVDDGYYLAESDLSRLSAQRREAEYDLVLVAPARDDLANGVRVASRAARGHPLVAVLDDPVDDALLRQVSELATDVIVAPYSLASLRAQVRASLVRTERRRAEGTRIARPGILDKLQFVDRLPAAELEAMLRSGVPCAFRPGDAIFNEGDPPGGLYYLHSGRARVYVRTTESREVTVGFAGAGETVGEMSAFDGAPRSATVIALEPIEATFVSREGFRRALSSAPETALRLLHLMMRRLRELDVRAAVNAEDEERLVAELEETGVEQYGAG
jgi:CRP-like cAMP-binding protein/phosphoribosyl 1,2-cyclic phosphodiesterase